MVCRTALYHIDRIELFVTLTKFALMRKLSQLMSNWCPLFELILSPQGLGTVRKSLKGLVPMSFWSWVMTVLLNFRSIFLKIGWKLTKTVITRLQRTMDMNSFSLLVVSPRPPCGAIWAQTVGINWVNSLVRSEYKNNVDPPGSLCLASLENETETHINTKFLSRLESNKKDCFRDS